MQSSTPQQQALPPKQDVAAPLVLLLDLDGTLVGKVGTILCEYEIGRWLAASGLDGGGGTSVRSKRATTTRTSSTRSAAVSKGLRDSIVRRMRYGIIRPHVHEFCKNLPPGVELFVYTASEDAWANFVVPCVEAALGVRFNRPIFSRSHCVRASAAASSLTSGGGVGDLRKTIRGLLPAIARSLGGTRSGVKRYPAVRGAADLKDRVVLVDNTAHVMADARESARVILCPTYSYQYGYDVLSRVPVEVLHTRFRALMPALERAGMFPEMALLQQQQQQQQPQQQRQATSQQINSYQRFAAVYYRRLSKVFEATLASNSAALNNDTFFLRLLHAINGLVRVKGGQTHPTHPTHPPLLTDANVAALALSLRGAR